MKILGLQAIAAVAFVVLAGCAQPPADSKKPPETASKDAATQPSNPTSATSAKADMSKVSYCIGASMAKGMSQQGLEVDPNAIAKGVGDAIQGVKPMLPDAALEAATKAYVTDLQKKAKAGGRTTPPVPSVQRPGAKGAPVKLNTPAQKTNYFLGFHLGQQFKQANVHMDAKQFSQGLTDGLSGGKLAMTDDEIKATLGELQKEQAAAAAKKAREFLDANAKKPGVKVTPSGLQYKVIKQGTGKTPSDTDQVVCNYRGTLIDGKEFDSSYKRGKPATFPVNGVIKGWTEALKMMPVGSKYQLFVPADLAYGERGQAGIPPNATLIFEVELLSIKK